MRLQMTTNCDCETSDSSDILHTMEIAFCYSHVVQELCRAVRLISKRSIDEPTSHYDGNVSVCLFEIVSDMTMSGRTLKLVYRERSPLARTDCLCFYISVTS
jgi:hypothetical protein